ncbi:MAG: hypothetical protein KF791_07765 [Verrucomicrobiae bacterium]|nr:hypothetical protein [Verrucomicrobiae bacterium]
MRRVWQLGVDDDPAVLYQPTREFSVQSGLKESPPGVVTRLPGDPEYSATANPSADDDYYFAGRCTLWVNGLSRELPGCRRTRALDGVGTGAHDPGSDQPDALRAGCHWAGAGRCRLSRKWTTR